MIKRMRGDLISFQSQFFQRELKQSTQQIIKYLQCSIIHQNTDYSITSTFANKMSKMRILPGCVVTNCDKCPPANSLTCTSCKKNFALTSSTSCDSCGSGYYYVNDNSPCGTCIINCDTCSNNTSCSKCKANYEVDSNKQCRACSIGNGQFYNQSNFTCQNCSNNCLTCSNQNICTQCQNQYVVSSTYSCIICKEGQGQHYDIANKTCINCPPNCLSCLTSNNCSQCKVNYELDTSSSPSKGCLACKINQGQYYDSSTKTCVNCISNCLQCTDASSCKLCQTGYYPNNTQCSLCSTSCLTCNGPNTNNCLSCSTGNYLYTDTSTCSSSCTTALGYYASQNQCSPCDKTCSTCNGPSNTQCITCQTGLYKFGSDNLCKTCPFTSSITITNCSTFSQSQCLYNNSLQRYEVTPICAACNTGYTLTSNQCVDQCSLITPYYLYDSTTSQCQCSSSYPKKHIKADGSVFCSSSKQPGFYCDSSNICYVCKQSNCYTCTDQYTCTLCNSGFYLWLNACQQTCPQSENLQISSSQTKCECAQNYILVTPQNICVIQLSITTINLSKDSQYNVITINFNRVPYPSEVSGISILLDPGKLVLNTDYTIVSEKLESNTAIFYISVEQNRKVNEIDVLFNSQKKVFYLQNALFTTSTYNGSQQSVQDNINSANNASKALTSGSGNAYKIISTLKQFQILCFLSNFIQFFGPLILFKNYLPQIVYVSTILASSFIFKSIPDANQLNATTQTSGTADAQNSEDQLLRDLGLQGNLYYALPIPNISLILSVIIVLLCCLARWLMKGKQYTMEIVNFLINVASSVQQGFITPSLFSIYYCLTFTQEKYFAIIQLLIHIAFFILIYCFSFRRDVNYIESYLPNFALNINTKARGWNTYLFASYLKKYVLILLILAMPTHPYVCGIILSIIFGSFGIYILYFRFFNSKFINIYKIIQEFLICVTVIMFTVCMKKQIDLIDSDIISDDDLKNIDKFSLIVIIMLASCLIMSFLLFLVRLIISFVELYEKLRNYLAKRNEKELLTESFDQILDQFNSSKQKSVVFNKIQIRKESTCLKEKPQKLDLEN